MLGLHLILLEEEDLVSIFGGYLLSKIEGNDFAYAVIKLDSQIDEDYLNQLKAIDELLDIKQICI